MSKPKKSKKFLLSTLTLLLLVLAGFLYVNASKNKDSQPQQETVNLTSPTEKERRAGDEQKKTILDDNSQNNTSNQSAQVVIIDAAQYDQMVEVRAFVSNVLKKGVCTISFQRSSHVIEKRVDANPEASSTLCMNVEVPRSEFPESGSWKVTVTYTSSDNTTQGTAEKLMEIK